VDVGGDRLRRLWRLPRYGQVQAIAELGNRADRAGAEHAAQARDLRRQVVLVDDETRPHALDERRLGHEPARTLREHEQEVECPRPHVDGLVAGAQEPLAGIDDERADPYQVHAATL
jgi:hypothetical protein